MDQERIQTIANDIGVPISQIEKFLDEDSRYEWTDTPKAEHDNWLETAKVREVSTWILTLLVNQLEKNLPVEETDPVSPSNEDFLRETRIIIPAKERPYSFAVIPHNGEYGLFKVYRDKNGLEVERELKMTHHKAGIDKAFDINEEAFFPNTKKVDSVTV